MQKINQLLLSKVHADDAEFLNETTIKFEFVEPDGWCDFETGLRILSPNDKIIFEPDTAEEVFFLSLKFQERLTEFDTLVSQL